MFCYVCFTGFFLLYWDIFKVAVDSKIDSGKSLLFFQLESAEAGRPEDITAKEILSLTCSQRAKAKEKVQYASINTVCPWLLN